MPCDHRGRVGDGSVHPSGVVRVAAKGATCYCRGRYGHLVGCHLLYAPVKKMKLTHTKIKNMANALADAIRALTLEKIDFVDDASEGIIDSLVAAALTLDDAGDAFTALAGDDVDQADVAVGLVDLADLFDDADLSPAQTDKLNGVVDKLLKSGSDEQKAAAKTLFSAALGFGIAAKSSNQYFNDLLATDPA